MAIRYSDGTIEKLDVAALQGIVFDKDGTLFDFDRVWSVWCERVLGELSNGNNNVFDQLAGLIGYEPASKSFVSGSLIVSSAASDTAAALSAALPGHNREAVNSVCLKHLQQLPLIPVNGLQYTLAGLQARGVQLGVATNDVEQAANSQLTEADVKSYFDFVCGCDSGYGSKPGPGMLQAFCDACQLQSSQIVMVGDSLHDINAGIAAKVGLTVGVLTGPASEQELQTEADVVLDDIGDLLQLLQLSEAVKARL